MTGVLPIWLTRLEAGRKLSDIEFLSIKEFGGKLKEDEGTSASTGTLATISAGAGKDMYLATAKVNFTGNINGSATVELQVNGVVKEIYVHNHVTGGSGAHVTTSSYEFVEIGQKVAATEVIRLQITANSGFTVNGAISCFEETTGETPQVQ